MNATRTPSGDQAGASSVSSDGSSQVSALVETSTTPTRAWVPRPLTKASRDPSGDQASARADPRARTAWVADGVPDSPASQIWPRWTKATASPLGDNAGPLPTPSWRGAPPATATAQTACSAPAASLLGLGISPARFGPPPRT